MFIGFVSSFEKYSLSVKYPSFAITFISNAVSMGFFYGSAGKESACSVGDLGSIPGLRRSPGEGRGYPLQYSGLENSMACIVHEVAKTQLSDFHKHIHNAIYIDFKDATWELKKLGLIIRFPTTAHLLLLAWCWQFQLKRLRVVQSWQA